MEQGGRQKTAGGIRARVRAEMLGEIKAAARRQLATDGANLSLRAIARELGLVSSALYRYFASRDELLTALILDAYNDMGAAVERAGDSVADRDDARARWLAVARASRVWALANPAEYGLLYGTPVPGYRGTPDTTAAAVRPLRVFGSILTIAPPVAAATPISPALSAEMEIVRQAVGATAAGDPLTVRGMIAWTQLFGAINFELFGRLDESIEQRAEWFDVQMTAMADYLGFS